MMLVEQPIWASTVTPASSGMVLADRALQRRELGALQQGDRGDGDPAVAPIPSAGYTNILVPASHSSWNHNLRGESL